MKNFVTWVVGLAVAVILGLGAAAFLNHVQATQPEQGGAPAGTVTHR